MISSIQKIDSIPISSNEIDITISNSAIENHFIEKWGIDEQRDIAMILVRVSAYTVETINGISIHRTRAARSSDLIGILANTSG